MQFPEGINTTFFAILHETLYVSGMPGGFGPML